MIFYFSGTGNTRWAAKRLAEATGESLLYIPDLMGEALDFTLQEGERLGVCFPVHGWRPPKIVRAFVSQLRIDATGHYVYALCTAGDTIGETIDILQSDLAKVGIHLDSAFSLIMPESYVGLPFMDVDTAANEKKKKRGADQQLKSLEPVILAKQKNVRKLAIGRWPRINSRVIGSIFVKKLVTDSPFRVKRAQCVRCGVCHDVCPVHDIEGGRGFEPKWKHDGSCLSCFTCYHHCPHHAIEYGCRTKHKGQYFFNRRKL